MHTTLNQYWESSRAEKFSNDCVVPQFMW